jgi:hypothetical protein
MARFCGNCGTEVDETAVFCPTCGQPIDLASETEIPAAPAWPDAPQEAGPPRVEPAAPPRWVAPTDDDVARVEDPTRVEAAPPPRPVPRHVPPPALPTAPEPPRQPALNVPVTWPVTMSGWLIGGGAGVAALGTVIGLFGRAINPIDLLLVLLLLGIAVTVFFSGSIPHIPHLRLATLAVVLVAFGIGLDRIGFGFAGVGELLLFLGAAAAVIGAILLELGRDQPLGGPRV